MFAARIKHPVTVEALGTDREAFAAAVAGWCEFVAAQPGCVAVVVLEERDDAVTALSLWQDQDSFAALFEAPDAMRRAAPLAPFFAAPSEPEALDVVHFAAGR